MTVARVLNDIQHDYFADGAMSPRSLDVATRDLRHNDSLVAADQVPAAFVAALASPYATVAPTAT